MPNQRTVALIPTALIFQLGLFENPYTDPDAAQRIALLDVVRGRFRPVGRLPLTIPADQAAVGRNAPDVPGYAETFEYAYTNRAKDRYIFGFGLSYGK